ncbi:MAG: FtsX-like permease family protein [Candidatus Cloacimonetes bacterium]|nr:FtsX-like permease family protein [Candidatus Cloacimonadota bacterium]MDD3234729.1 FtsX-like permease family protein [Candidatus Cloacimonadota bacterium]
MITKLAIKRILGNGWHSVINIAILSIVLLGIVLIQSIYDGWSRTARRQLIEWENGNGHYEQQNYDKYDSFTIDKSYAPIPEGIQTQIDNGEAVPILVSTGMLYPNGRMTPITIKGIPYSQTLLKIPTQYLKITDNTSLEIPVVIGQQMAKSAEINEGDTIPLRWKDVNGVFNAYDVVVAKIMRTPVPSIDVSQVWMDFAKLNELKELQNSTTIIVLKSEPRNTSLGKEWKYISTKETMESTKAMINADKSGGYVILALMMFLAMVAIFDTQTLAIFKRKKEIGTLLALGMPKKQIIKLFTLEGSLYMLLGTIVTAVLGLPIFLYLGIKGIQIPQEVGNMNVVGVIEPMKSYFSPFALLFIFIIMMALTVYSSWLPAAKIARMKATDAIKGKA